MKRIVYHPEARAELLAAADWYENQQPGVGLNLHDDVNAALAKISRDPGIGARYRNGPHLFYRLKRFPYVIYYRELANVVWIAAIAHGRRRENYWRKRKP